MHEELFLNMEKKAHIIKLDLEEIGKQFNIINQVFLIFNFLKLIVGKNVEFEKYEVRVRERNQTFILI